MSNSTERQAKRPTRPLLSALSTIWFWFSTVTSVIGLAGIVEDLKIWVAAAANLLSWARSIWPSLAEGLQAIGAVIHVALDAFRSVARPLFDLLLGWLPFKIPVLAKDAVVVVAFVATGLLRVWFKSERDLKRWQQHLKGAGDKHALARRHGIELVEDHPDRSPAVFSRALYGYGDKDDLSLKQGARDQGKERYEKGLRNFGPEVESAAIEHAKLWGRHGQLQNALTGGKRLGTRFVWIAASLTTLLILIDFVLMP